MSDSPESVPQSASGRSAGDTNTEALSERDTLPPKQSVTPEDVGMTESSSKSFGTIPAEFGRYRILKLLGQGGMGSVYLAHDTELDRKVALKIPKFRESESNETIERFYREARASATLRSANICPIYDVGEIGGVRYISMAYIAGRQLSDYLASGKRLSSRQIALLVRKLAVALQDAHDRGVVHRDLKPSNIMLDAKHEPIIMDFGLARQMDQTEDERLTQEGAIIGSPAYMSPEQVEGRWAKIGPACDIYSLGVVLYELLAGRTPFTGSIASVIGQIVSKAPKKPSAWRPEVDSRLEAICLKMLAKRIGNRFVSMSEVVQALTGYLKSASKVGERDANATIAPGVSGETSQHKRHKVSAQDVADLLELSQEFMERHDYAQVIQLLEAIPPRRRTNAVLELLDKATDLQDEVTWLISDLKDAVSKHEYEGLLPNVKRLLELKPGHEKAQKVYEQLTGKPVSGGSRRRAKRMRGFAARSGSRRTTGDSWLSTSIATMIAVGIVAFGLMTWGITIYLRSDNQTVKVEIDDSVRAEDVSVSIDGNQIEIEGIGETITLKRGEHELEIKRGDMVARTQEFQVFKGEKNLLRISLGKAGERGRFKGDVSTSMNIPNPPRTPLPDGPPGLVHTFEGHEAPVHCVAFSPDGKWVLSGTTQGGMVCLWDVENRKLLKRFEIDGNWCTSLLFLADGKRAAIAHSPKGMIRIFDLEAEREIDKWKGGYAARLALTEDGQRLIALPRSAVRTWNVEDGREIANIAIDDRTRVRCRAVSTIAKRVLTGNEEGDLTLRELSTGAEIRGFHVHDDQVMAVSFSSDGRQALSGAADGTLVLSDLETGKAIRPLIGHGSAVHCVTFSPDGRTALSSGGTREENPRRTPRDANGDFSVRLWDVKTGQELHRFDKHTDTVRSVVFSPDGRFVLSASWDKTVRLWRLPKPSLDEEVQVQETPGRSENSRDRSTPSEAGSPAMPTDEPVGEVRQFVGHTGYINDLVVSADGKRALSASSDASLIVWDVPTGKAIHRLQGHRAHVVGVAVSPDASLALSGGADETLRLWDLRSGNEVRRFEGHRGPVYGVAISHDRRYGLSGSDDQTVRLWDLRTGREIRQFSPQKYRCRSVAFSPDDRYVLAGSLLNGKEVRLWSVETGELAHEFHGVRGSSEHVTFSPDGRSVLTSGYGGVILWDIETGRRVRQFSERTLDVMFSPKGRYAFCGSWYRQLFLWDLKTGQLVHHVKTERNITSCVAFLPDGRHALTAGGLIPNPWRPDIDFAIHLWRLPKLNDEALK